MTILREAVGKLRETVDLLIWAYTPFRPLDVAGVYDLLATNALTADGLYLNLGYWKKARTIDRACEALATLVAKKGDMRPGDDVVDVGFGFAEQDALWLERFAPRHITGFNVTASQVRVARERIRMRRMDDRIALLEGSATNIPLPASSCDIVTAVECAFHFDTRETFFAEAYRILRPGGRVVLADIIRNAPSSNPLHRAAQDITWNMFAQKFAVPSPNADCSEGYAEKLRAAGFKNICVSSMSEHVFPGWHNALRDDPALMARLPLAGRLPYKFLSGVEAMKVYGAFNYVLAVAQKSL